jgi:hypothetical protein
VTVTDRCVPLVTAAYGTRVALMALTEIPHCCSPKFPR